MPEKLYEGNWWSEGKKHKRGTCQKEQFTGSLVKTSRRFTLQSLEWARRSEMQSPPYLIFKSKGKRIDIGSFQWVFHFSIYPVSRAIIRIVSSLHNFLTPMTDTLPAIRKSKEQQSWETMLCPCARFRWKRYLLFSSVCTCLCQKGMCWSGAGGASLTFSLSLPLSTACLYNSCN